MISTEKAGIRSNHTLECISTSPVWRYLRQLTTVTLSLIIVTTIPSCNSGPPPAPPVLVEASDYGPIGEALKFLGLCFLGISIVYAAASIIKNINE